MGQARFLAQIYAALKLHRVKYLARVNPLLAALLPVSFLYAHNTGKVPFSSAGAAMLAVLAGTVMCTTFRTCAKPAMFTSR